MDFVISLVLSAIASSSSKDVVAQQATDAYGDLKRLIAERYPDVDVSVLERKPDSEAKKASLAEDLDDAGAAGDRALASAAVSALCAVHRPEAAPTKLPTTALAEEEPTRPDPPPPLLCSAVPSRLKTQGVFRRLKPCTAAPPTTNTLAR
ncbi:hypothetical protein [Nocardia aobensis]|uniref:hypothetical protein n=1 Tax=Nocardia aobensis TaxID=257277 RepID=UPI00031CF1E6|nr:hypothetical protein [Nocardia aobensis]